MKTDAELEQLAHDLHRCRSLAVAELVMEHDVPAIIHELINVRRQLYRLQNGQDIEGDHVPSLVPVARYEALIEAFDNLESRHSRLVRKRNQLLEQRRLFRALLIEIFGDDGGYISVHGYPAAISEAIEKWKRLQSKETSQ